MLCNDDMEFVQVVNDYLLYMALEDANTASPATWKSHAESLYDYFSWLDANNLNWNDQPTQGKEGQEISNLASYRNWSMDLIDPVTSEARISSSTIRKRLSQLMAFYRWAKDRNWITALPWRETFRMVTLSESNSHMYRHTHAGRIFVKDNIRPKVPRKPIQLLNLDQCRILMRACGTETLQLMTKLMLQSGIRNEECRTFSRNYVFDPSSLDSNKKIPIELSPTDMSIKGNKPRRIYISWHLMKELFDYLNFGEGAQRAKAYRAKFGIKAPSIFLNQGGEFWSEKGLNNAYRKLWTSTDERSPLLGFRVTPHMLRHTFATLELYAESQRTNLAAALVWVRDRLGHASIKTTTIYIHCLDLMGEWDLNIYQQEIDTILSGGSFG
jgi:integrase